MRPEPVKSDHRDVVPLDRGRAPLESRTGRIGRPDRNAVQRRSADRAANSVEHDVHGGSVAVQPGRR